jgi:hypothetical protein
VTRARENRLDQLAADDARKAAAADLDHGVLEAWAAVCAFVRDGLVRAGIDPACARALQLAHCRDPFYQPDPAPQAAESSDGKPRVWEGAVTRESDSLADLFAEKIGALARQYEDGREPNFANASLAELFAWCISRQS